MISCVELYTELGLNVLDEVKCMEILTSHSVHNTLSAPVLRVE